MSETIKFNPTVSPRKENIYIEEYYSGVDCNVYIDGKLFSNVSGISFQIQEQLKPLYGYASRTFDDVAVGNRIVIGSLQIPITNPENTDLSIDKKDKNLDLRTNEISSKKYLTKPSPIVNNFDIVSVPDWVKEWVKEYGYEPSGEVKSNLASAREVFMSDTMRAQQKLSALGYNINLNGIQDIATERALLSYQIQNGLSVTGILDNETYRKIMGILSPEGKNASVDVSSSVRTGPSSSYPVFYILTPSETVSLVSEHGTYSRIKIADGRNGYIKTDLLKIVEEDPA